jgi:hypothetical protein
MQDKEIRMQTFREFLTEEQLHQKMDKKMLRKINKELRAAGFDGNGRFRRPDKSTFKMQGVFDKFKVSIATIINPYTLPGDSGSQHLDLVFDHPTDKFQNIQITNTMLYITWQKLKKDRFEVLAYLTS